MKIISYKFAGVGGRELIFSEIKLRSLNMFVGESGSGKTKLLNTIFNIGHRLITDGVITPGSWDISCEHKGISFRWVVKCA